MTSGPDHAVTSIMQHNCETGAGSAAVPIYGVRDRVPSIVTRLDRLGLVSVGYQLGTSFSTVRFTHSQGPHHRRSYSSVQLIKYSVSYYGSTYYSIHLSSAIHLSSSIACIVA